MLEPVEPEKELIPPQDNDEVVQKEKHAELGTAEVADDILSKHEEEGASIRADSQLKGSSLKAPTSQQE